MPIIAIYFLKKTFFPLSFENQPQQKLCVNKLSAVKNVKIFNFTKKICKQTAVLYTQQ